MAVSVRQLNRQTSGSVDRALQFETELSDLYAQQLRRTSRHAAAQFAARAPVTMTAASNPRQPGWVPPDPDELVGPPLDEQARRKARMIHLKAFVAATPPAIQEIAGDIGISFDVTSPFVAPLLDRVGERIVSLSQETRDVVRKVIAEAYQDGWSVAQTAAALQSQVDHLGATTAVMQARTDLVGLGNGASLASARALGDAAPATKTWLTAGDERVRDTHGEADGQEVPIDQPFQVGDDLLMYPGDPDGSDGEVINCRCALVYSDGVDRGDSLEASAVPALSSAHPGEHLPSPVMGQPAKSPADIDPLVAAVTITVDDDDVEPDGDPDDMPEMPMVRWRGILCVEGEDSQDGPGLIRMLAEGGGSWRTPPLPLGAMFETPHALEVPAPIAGAIDRIWRNPDNQLEIWGEGWLNTDETGCRAAELVGNGSLRGISIDPYVAEMDIIEPPGQTDEEMPDVMDAAETVTTVQPTRMIFKRYVIGGATICPFQALEDAQVAIVAAAHRGADEPTVFTDSRIHLVASDEGGAEGEALTAAATAAPPAEWFETQESPGPMPLTVTDDGRVFGHLALWDSCHTGFGDACVRPPRSRSGYAYFHVGELETADGTRVSVGKLMIASPGRAAKHAAVNASRMEAARHYDNNAAVGAYIRVIDGRYGPWAAGVVRPGLDEDGLAQLRANPPSGDWRKVNGALDLIAALSVPVPGFPVPRANVGLVASGGLLDVEALIASSGEVQPSALVVMALEQEGLLPSSRPRVARPAVA